MFSKFILHFFLSFDLMGPLNKNKKKIVSTLIYLSIFHFFLVHQSLLYT